jgi:hypothetical protein
MNRLITKLNILACGLVLPSLLSLSATLAFGQVEAGSIDGTVRDTSGAVIPGATVTSTSMTTGVERSATTGTIGQYSIPGLNVGTYEVTVKSPNFETFETQAEVTVGAITTVNAQLNVGKNTVVVKVVATAIAVNTETQELSQLVNSQKIAHLPSLTRNPYDFVALSGNVSNGDSTSNGGTTSIGGGGQELFQRGVGYAINGQRESGTEILLDGVENVSVFNVGVGTNIPVDGVQEYSVVTNNFSAEYGRASGGVVNVTSKAGTNNWHGSGWEFNRLSAYTANTYNNVVNHLPKGKYTRNQFGFQIGGPIIKNKLFVSESTEFTRVRSNSVQTEEIFDPSFIFGNSTNGYPGLPANAQAYFKSFGTTTLPTAAVASTWGQWVASSGCFFGAGTGGSCVNPLLDGKTVIPNSQPVMDTVNFTAPFNAGGGPEGDIYTLVGRLDYNPSDKTQMFFRAARDQFNLFPGTNSYSAYPQYDTGTLNQDETYLLSVNHSFSSSLFSNTKLSSPSCPI